MPTWAHVLNLFLCFVVSSIFMFLFIAPSAIPSLHLMFDDVALKKKHTKAPYQWVVYAIGFIFCINIVTSAH